MQKPSNILHSDLLLAQKLIYEPNGLICSNTQKEAESKDYGACTFDLNNRSIKFRVAKITPTKIGQFVFATLFAIANFWRRSKKEPSLLEKFKWKPLHPRDVEDVK